MSVSETSLDSANTSSQAKSRLEQLSKKEYNTQNISKNYSRFVKIMRYVLPIAAVGLIVVVFTWSDMDDRIVALPKEDVVSKSNMGENELLNPQFETTDSQQNPVKVNAKRATQNQENPDLVRLEEPTANLKMKDGSTVTIEAENGTYEQKVEKLYLSKDVKIQHEDGYSLEAKELRINMKTREAFSDKAVQVRGPEGAIDALGLEGNVDEGILIFKGPATLRLNQTDEILEGATQP